MQQSDTEPRKAPKVQGHKTHEQQQRIINKQENTKGTDAPLTDETLKHAAMRYPGPGPGDENQMSMATARSSRAPMTRASIASGAPTADHHGTIASAVHLAGSRQMRADSCVSSVLPS